MKLYCAYHNNTKVQFVHDYFTYYFKIVSKLWRNFLIMFLEFLELEE